MKSWADHCSSDEESDDNESAPGVSVPPSRGDNEEKKNKMEPATEEEEENENDGPHVDNGNKDEEMYPPSSQRQSERRQYHHNDVLPTEPPFTARLGNLSFHIRDSDQLGHEVQNFVDEMFHRSENPPDLRILDARLTIDRDSGRPKGTGFVEFRSVEGLEAMLELRDAEFFGRRLRVDVAQPRATDRRRHPGGSFTAGGSTGSLPGIDGSSFRGGRFARNNSASSSQLQRETSLSSLADGQEQPPQQRHSLQLAPRSKPVADQSSHDDAAAVSSPRRTSSRSSIFGDAKPRDELAWEMRRRSSSNLPPLLAGTTDTSSKPHSNNNTHHSPSEDKNHDTNSASPAEAMEKPNHDNDKPKNRPGDTAAATTTTTTVPSRQGRGHGGRSHGGRGGGGRGGRGDGRRKESEKRRNDGPRGALGRGDAHDRHSGNNKGGKRAGGGASKHNPTKDFDMNNKKNNGDFRTAKKTTGKNKELPVQQISEKKSDSAPTKVTNSFAALGFDSDSD